MRVKFIFIISFVAIAWSSSAQGGPDSYSKDDKKLFEKAELLVEDGDFIKAFDIYKGLEEKYKDDATLLYRLGICKTTMEGGDEEALSYYRRIKEHSLDETDFGYYYGYSLHRNYKFEEAITVLEEYLKTHKPEKDFKDKTERIIQNCKNGIELVRNPASVKITTLGDPLNTMHSEYAPMISANERTILYTYRGEKSVGGLQPVPGTNRQEYNEDVLISYKDSSNTWFEPLVLPQNINTPGNDACVAISPDAQLMYLFRSIDNDPGSLYSSELDGATWSDPVLIRGEVNSPAWEGSITISHDGRKVIFASERPGGEGNRDIYEARIMADGSWGKVKNLGKEVNTKYNDDAPFLHPSGKYLVFSSEGHNSMGGYDIFVSELQEDSTWGAPKNIGHPINSPMDDKFYTVTADGHHGYYSTGKKGGMGKQDVYYVSPGIDKTVVLFQVVGQVFLDDVPIFAEIEVTDDAAIPLKTKYNSNSISGKFLIDLPPSKVYKLKFVIGGMEPKTVTVDARNITGFVEKYVEVRFYSDGDPTKIDTMITTPTSDTAVIVVNNTSTTFELMQLKDTGLHIMKMTEFLDFSHPQLTYRVQVGAYRFPQNFRVEKYERDEKSVKEKLDDGITRFTIKQFNSLRQAYAYRDEMVKIGVHDAFVTAIYKGKRYLLVEIREVLAKTLPYETK